MNKSCVAACLESVRMAVESVSGCSWNECPDQRGITVRMCVEWVSESAWNPQQSHGTPIFYVDLTVRGGIDMSEALRVANELDVQRQAAGFDQTALDEVARRGFGNGAFEDSEEDSGAVIDEFFSVESSGEPSSSKFTQQPSGKPSLAERLESQCQTQSLNA